MTLIVTFVTLRKNSSKIRQQMNGGSVMSWIAVGYNGQMDVQFIDYQTNVTMYKNLNSRK